MEIDRASTWPRDSARPVPTGPDRRVRVRWPGEVAFGPFGRPVRRWAAEDIGWARAENRTPAQVGGRGTGSVGSARR